MKKQFLSILLFGLFFSLTACAATAIKLGESDNGTTINLNTGDKFTLTLPGNPTTGYSWEISEIDSTLIELVGEPAYETDSNRIGSGGMFTFTFKALSAGRSNIKLIYHRSFEQGVEPADIYQVTLDVK